MKKKISKATLYQSIIYGVLTLTIGFSAFLLTSDNLLPFTTQATMQKNVANIAPEVSGVIAAVYVNNGQQVNAGDRLFSIDKATYALAVKQAEAELHLAQEANSSKWQALQSAEQSLAQRQAEWQNAKTKLTRYQQLLSKGLSTQQNVDDVRLNSNVAKSAVKIAQTDILRIKAELSGQNNNAATELASAKLAQAKLALTNTNVTAKTAGTISNLRLQAGSYAAKGAVVLFLVNENSRWLNADFNEKGLTELTPGTTVAIAFDAIPGQVFSGQLINQDSAIYDASSSSNQLAVVANNNRWIRQQQKIRTRIQLQGFDTGLIAGSRASVIVQHEHSLLSAFGYGWITLVSYFRYIY
jgi:multidrug resistance efflux pump